MKMDGMHAMLDGLGTKQGVLYTNEQMITSLDNLQHGLAGALFDASHADCARAKEIIDGMRVLLQEHGLESSPEFLRFTENMDKLGHTVGALVKGRSGERNTMKALQLLALDKGVRILYNIAIQDAGLQMEYDAIVLTPYGVFVVEVKNYNETMHLTENGMLQQMVNPTYQYNLGGRMNGKEYLLRKALGNIFPATFYHGILLYSNEFSNIVDDFHRIQISYRNTIVQDIKAYDTGVTLFTEDQITDMEKTLVDQHCPRKSVCKVNCQAIIEDFVFLLETIDSMKKSPREQAEPARLQTPQKATIQATPQRTFSWKDFWKGVISGALLTGFSVFAVSKLNHGTRA